MGSGHYEIWLNGDVAWELEQQLGLRPARAEAGYTVLAASSELSVLEDTIKRLSRAGFRHAAVMFVAD